MKKPFATLASQLGEAQAAAAQFESAFERVSQEKTEDEAAFEDAATGFAARIEYLEGELTHLQQQQQQRQLQQQGLRTSLSS